MTIATVASTLLILVFLPFGVLCTSIEHIYIHIIKVVAVFKIGVK